MEPNAKNSKPNEPTQMDELQLLDLNDDCIRHIFWKLPPADLCSISLTCRRMQELAFDHFPRQYPDQRLTVQITDERAAPHFRIKETEKHLKYFAKYIRNIRISCSGTYGNLQALFDYVNAECSADIRSLQLDVYSLLKKENVQVIENRLENLASLSIHHPDPRLDIHDLLLKYCKKIEYFEILSYTDCDVNWMVHEYPTMKSVCMNRDTETITSVCRIAETFFRLNPQITNVKCARVINTKFIWPHANNVQRMSYLSVQADELPILIDQFTDDNKEHRHRLAWLELNMQLDKFTSAHYRNLERVNAVQPIQSLSTFLHDSANETRLIAKLHSVVQLKFLIPFQYAGINELLDATSKLPNLEDLRLNLDVIEWSFKDVVMRFIQRSPKMRNLNFTLCVRNTFVFHPNDLVELNNLRMSTSCASPITIRLGYDDAMGIEIPQFNYTANSAVKLIFAKKNDPKVWEFS